MSQASTDKGLLTQHSCVVAFIDHQPGMLARLPREMRARVLQGALRLAKTCRAFSLPVVSSAIAAPGFDGCLLPQIQKELAPVKPVRHTSINAWDADGFSNALRKTARRNVVTAGLWTESHVLFPVLQMLEDGFYLYIVEDASGSEDPLSHEAAIRRMEQAGAVSVTSLQLVQELQRDWARKDTAAQAQALLQHQKTSPARKGVRRSPKK